MINKELAERALGAALIKIFTEVLLMSIIGLIPAMFIWVYSSFNFLVSWYLGALLTMFVVLIICPVLYWGFICISLLWKYASVKVRGDSSNERN